MSAVTSHVVPFALREYAITHKIAHFDDFIEMNYMLRVLAAPLLKLHLI